MTKQTKYSFETRKKIVEILYNESVEKHPWWKEERELPGPIYPPSLKNVFLEKKDMATINIPDIQKSVICGTVLGDSSIGINKNYKNARMQNRHSTLQASWFFWKWMICLKCFNKGLSSYTFQERDGFQGEGGASREIYGKLKVSSSAKEELTELTKQICKKNKKMIERRWLNHMNNYFLMTLWLDDGSLSKSRQGIFCLDSIPKEQQEILKDYLKVVWDIDCYVKLQNPCTQKKEKYIPVQQEQVEVSEEKEQKKKTPSYRILFINQENLLKFLRIIAPVVPVKDMLYKIMFVPENNLDLLQRWASELEELVYPEFKEYIKTEYQKIILKQKEKHKKKQN